MAVFLDGLRSETLMIPCQAVTAAGSGIGTIGKREAVMAFSRRKRRSMRHHPEALENRCLLATITVTSLDDNTVADGEVTLREAILAANTDSSVDGSVPGSGPDTIVFAADAAGTVELRQTLKIESPITLRGLGAETTRIDGGAGTRLFRVLGGSGGDPTFAVEDLTLRNGRAPSAGSAILADRQRTTIALRNVTVANNNSEDRGAVAISSQNSQLTVEDSEFLGNQSELGGGIWLTGFNTTFEISGTVFRDNSADVGGAIALGAFTFGEISDSAFEQNSSNGHGGAIASILQSDVMITGSNFIDNIAGASGGAIYGDQGNGEADSAEIEVESSSFVGNRAGTSGGAIRVLEGRLTNSTVSGNVANSAALVGVELISNSTVVGNTGATVGGIAGGTLVSSLVAGNTGTTPDVSGVTATNSVIGDNTGSGLAAGAPDADGNFVGTAGSPVDPLVLPLVDFGRGRIVHPLQPTSVALDSGDNPQSLIADQRGAAREQGAGTDIGAFEGTLAATLAVAGSPASAEGDTGTTALVFDVTVNGTTGQPFTVDVETVDGTATVADADYQPVSRNLQFDGTGNQTVSVTVLVNGDDVVEGHEQFTLRIMRVSLAGIVVTDTADIGTISNDDAGSGIFLSGGVLTVQGTDGADVIRFEQTADMMQASLNGSTQDFPLADVERLHAVAGDGNDQVTTAAVTVPMVVDAGAGDDTVKGGIGNDTISGGEGHDRLRGTKGNDHIFGGAGDDLVRGQEGGDMLIGGAGNDTLQGDAGVDTMWGSDGADQLSGGGSADELDGGAGNDRAVGGAGRDMIIGGGGNDLLNGGSGNDTLNGGDGDDTASGGRADDVLIGGDGNDRLDGGTGDDELNGDEGSDRLVGDEGRDLLVGDGGDDELRGGADGDRLLGGDGDDDVVGGSGNDFVAGGDGNDNLDGGSGNDEVYGGLGRDTLAGQTGNDLLVGGRGPDVLNAGNGRDVLFGDSGRDTMRGGGGDDLIVTGSLQTGSTPEFAVHDTVVREWFSDRSYDERVANIRRGAGRTTNLSNSLIGVNRPVPQNVFEDGDVDQVEGNDGRDWFFASLETDNLLDLVGNERRDRI